MFIDFHYSQKTKELSYFYIDQKGKTSTKTVRGFRPYKWVTTSEELGDKKYRSWDNKPVRKEETDYVDRYVGLETLWRMSEKNFNDVFCVSKPKELFVDIETEFVEGKFPEASLAEFKVLTISLVSFNEKNDRINVIIQTLKPLNDKEQSYISKGANEYIKDFNFPVDITYKDYGSEIDMLEDFLVLIRDFPIITGWNFLDFDWKYIYNRCNNLGVDFKKAFGYKVRVNKKEGIAIPKNKAVLDLMQLFQTYDRSINVRESMSLDFISNEVLGIKKVKYDGSLNDLYRDNFKDYVFYNIVDSILCLLIENKNKILKLYYALSSTSFCQLEHTLKATRSTETVLSYYFFNKLKRVLPSKEIDDNDIDKSKYGGAYVKEPIPNLYKWVMGKDYKSLYPTSMRAGNISPETFIDKNYIPTENEYEYLKENTIYKAPNNTYFEAKEMSIMKMILTEFSDNRQHHKKLMNNAKKELKELKKLKEKLLEEDE